MRHGQNHEQRVLSVCFDDALKVYMSCSQDSTVKVWDYEKRLVRTVVLNNPSSSVACNGNPGDVVVTQGTYLLTIPRAYWDEGDALQQLRNAQDPWDVLEDSLTGAVMSFILKSQFYSFFFRSGSTNRCRSSS